MGEWAPPGSSRLASLLQRSCSPAACRQRFVPSVRPTSSARYVRVLAHQPDQRPPFPGLFSSPWCLPHLTLLTFKLPRPPSSPTPHQAWAGAQLGGGGRVPGGAISGPFQPPASLVAPRQLYGGRMEAVSLLAGLFLHFSRLALIFHVRFPGPPPPLPLHASPPSPSNLSAQPGERATGLQGD